jgi:hypothetical protein
MIARSVKPSMSQQLCGERLDEAALFAAVSVGADVTVGEPTMA